MKKLLLSIKNVSKMITLYEVNYDYQIKEQQVTKVNDKSFWFLNPTGEEERGNRTGNHINYFDTYKEAYEFALRKLQLEIRSAEHLLDYAKNKKETFLQSFKIV